MIGKGQEQKVAENSTAMQAARDIIVGPSLSEVMTIVSQSIQFYTEAAKSLVNERLNEFEKRLEEKIARGDTAALEVFADPDMQGALLDAQKAYVRSDSESLHGVLTDLIYQRASRRLTSRTSLALNDAIRKSANLTKVDFANLAFIFYVMDVGLIGNSATEFVSERFHSHLSPITDSLDFSMDALEYLESNGLLLSGPGNAALTPRPLAHVLKSKYPEAFNTGFDPEELNALHPNTALLRLTNSIAISPFDPQKVYVRVNEKGLDNMAGALPGLEGFGAKYKAACQGRLVDNASFVAEVSKVFPDFSLLCSRYDESRVGVTRLSLTGKAIGHAYLCKETSFLGDLEIWIKP
ncbi:LPO_1073/Vpar_1526 family protein [Phaeovulum vinaykumarii]|uniref:Uncharacterized protein n=1 Tax=Phaeovulum vinaykumarii TaxID=407234 RepID=A0A1N7K680_9RHOB|nr:LPO_1073/Vpar_1526 family protein [Phaeovulum vinaykumarii]SIS57102.1 hypothetical protein SAMN05421795_101648 [Phaeovulum vinaykumarii]SOB93273.1 hypothetical protein SAMN05878426_101645 [Phaeovulum vinaykumarii]